jgi:hypothetical protein
MDYGILIRRAWQITWHNRFLWVLGLFATTTVGSCSPLGAGNGLQWRTSLPDVERLYTPDVARAFEDADPFISQNIALILLGIVAVVLLVSLLFLAVSLTAQGGMARSTVDLVMGLPQSAGNAWRLGLRLALRYLLLWLLLVGVGILVALLLAAAIAAAFLLGAAVQGPARTGVMIMGGLASVLLILIAVPVYLAVAVIVAFAQRAILADGAGAWMAFRSGYRLLLGNLGTSALAWLISLMIGIGAGIAIAVAAGVFLAILGVVGAGLYAAGGISASLIVYAILALLLFIVGIWFLGGVANAFFWNYWTLIYLYLTGRLTARLEPLPDATAQ